jgi:hypothetical protein
VQVIRKSFGADDNLDWLTDEVAKHPAWNTSKSPMILALWHKRTSSQLEKLEEMGVEVSFQPSICRFIYAFPNLLKNLNRRCFKH